MPGPLKATLALAAAAFLLGAANASAAEEVGNRCVANDSEANWTVIGLSNGGGSPLLQPQVVSGGVITRWKTEVAPGTGPLAQQLVVLQQVGEEDDRKVGESAVETVVDGVNEFSTRIPAPEYAHIGLHGPVETLFCDKEEGNTAGIVEGAFAVGETRHFKVGVDVGTPVTAIVEPDRDRDGYGDETQDSCPQSAAVQGDCPVVTLSARAVAKRRVIVVRVNTNADASIRVLGQVGWNFRPKRERPVNPSKRTKRLIVALRGGRKDVAAGATARFNVRLPKLVLRRLGRISPSESLKAKITVQATDLAGRITNRRLRVKLKGREKS